MLVVVDGEGNGSTVTLMIVSVSCSPPAAGVLFNGCVSYAQDDIDHIIFPSADLATTS